MSESEADNLIRRFLADDVTPELVAELEAWVREDKTNARLLAEHGLLEQMMVSQQVEDDASSVMASLLEMERQADPIELVNQPAAFASELSQGKGQDMLAASDYKAAGAYFFGHLLRRKPAILAYAAAVVLLVSLFFVPWGESEDEASPSIAGQSDNSQPAEVPPPQISTVAVLTAERNAVWDRRPGDDLYAGQRLTLKEGFAEITTARGAIAIVQAPSTVELIDDNALRLLTGKMVGICETESSKGFLVRTPHMGITDLGTRFGIDANADTTEVHVFDGKVQAQRLDAAFDAEPTRLVANQSARTSSETRTITTIDHNAERFAALLPTTVQLPGTGQGLAVDDIDPNWQIVAIDGKPLDQPKALRVSNRYKSDPHLALPSSSQWIAWDSDHKPKADSYITYHLRTQVNLPDSINLDSARLRLQCTADNQLRAIHINGQKETFDYEPDFGDWQVHTRKVNGPLVHGMNTIEFEVADHWLEGTIYNLVGLKLDWQLIPRSGWAGTNP